MSEPILTVAPPAPIRANPLRRALDLLDAGFGTYRGFIRYCLGELEYIAGRLDRHTAIDLAQAHRLVFVCLGNINRSAFAEALARAHGLHAVSIGLSTTTGAPAFYKALTTARRFGVELADHRATNLADYRHQAGDLLLVMEVRHARRLVALGFPADMIALLGHWSAPQRIHIHDPHVLSDAYFRTCFSVLDSAVRGLNDALRAAGSPCVRP